jgi:hypothetical protein
MKIIFTEKKTLRLPTIYGWIVVFVAFAVVCAVCLKGLYPFLSVNRPVKTGIMVVEGWLPDYVLDSVVCLFKSNHYEKLIVTGGPLEHGTYLMEYKTYAGLNSVQLRKMGLDSQSVIAVAAPEMKKDRTYTSALELKKWMDSTKSGFSSFNIVSMSVHSRRSLMLFKMALGKGYNIGMISFPDSGYDADRWWMSSDGFRKVTDEFIAWIYARFLFVK